MEKPEFKHVLDMEEGGTDRLRDEVGCLEPLRPVQILSCFLLRELACDLVADPDGLRSLLGLRKGVRIRLNDLLSIVCLSLQLVRGNHLMADDHSGRLGALRIVDLNLKVGSLVCQIETLGYLDTELDCLLLLFLSLKGVLEGGVYNNRACWAYQNPLFVAQLALTNVVAD
jgi:hypothetical protein